MLKKLSIIVISYKTPVLLLRCIDSIKETLENIDYEIIVVDNCSNDNSKELVCLKYNDVIWIDNLTNEGFGKANNIGVEISKGEYLLLLNSDMVLVPGTVESCIVLAQNNFKIGVVGCRLVNEDGTEQKSVFSIASYQELLNSNLLYNYFFKTRSSKSIALMGAFFLVPKRVFVHVGGFDPDFFMYCEELELCSRIKRAGFEIVLNNSVYAIHKHGGSSSNRYWVGKQKLLSAALLFLKLKGIGGYILYHIIYSANFCMNFWLMWFIDKSYRNDFWFSLRCYFSNFFYYITIPFLFSKKVGTGKRLLKRS